VCGTALWSRSVLHHIESTRGVIGALTRIRHGTVQGGTTVSRSIQRCTDVCRSVQWHVEEYMDNWWCARVYDVAQQGLRVLPPGRLTDGDTGHTFGGSSPRIDGETDERYLAVSAGTHTPNPLLHHSQAQSILLLSCGTLGISSRVCEAHPRYLDDT